MVDNVQQFVTPCKKRTSILILAISKALEIPVTMVAALCGKKLETIQASRHRASGGSPVWQADWCSVTGYYSNQKA